MDKKQIVKQASQLKSKEDLLNLLNRIKRDEIEEMGFDAFISLEYMYDVEKTSIGWAKDKTLVDDIMKCLKDTKSKPDLVYTISVQGHGQYPDGDDTCTDHVQLSYDDKSVEKKFHYYVNQIYEMDQMIAELIKQLDAYGEDYVLVLYGDHLPSLDLTEERLPNSTLFQTEYIIVNNIYTPITVFTYFLFFPSGKIISIMVAIITAKIIPCAHEFMNFINFNTYLYIIPLLVIFIHIASPIISSVATKNIIPSNTLNVPPICSNSETIFLSAIGSHMADVK